MDEESSYLLHTGRGPAAFRDVGPRLSALCGLGPMMTQPKKDNFVIVSGPILGDDT